MVVALVAVGVAIALGAGSAPAVSPTGVSVAGNERAAKRDGRELLSRLTLPAGAMGSQREPVGGGSALASSGPAITSRDVVDQHAWWVVPQSVQAVLAFVRAHPPGGSRLESSGSGSQYGATTSWSLRYGWQPVRSVLNIRALSMVFVRLPSGSTGVLAESEDMWDRPKPTGERIPSSARVLAVAVTHPHQRPSPSIIVTDPATVAKIATAIDALETVQPVAIVCPMIPVEQAFVTLTFSATRGGPVLARASEPASAAISECEPMQLTISGHAQTPLLDGATVVALAQKLLGVHLG
jgi:hypothetical protein